MILHKKSIIVTGASRGIGRAIALACIREGATVGVNYLQSAKAAEELYRQNAPQLRLLRFDVSDDVNASKSIQSFAEEQGGVHCLVNCAGILAPSLLIRSRISDIRRQIAVNLLGTILCSQLVLPMMLRQQHGVILNVSSAASERPAPGQSVYSASKAAVEGFTRALAVEYGRKNIRALALRLGPVETDMLRPVLSTGRATIASRLIGGRLATPAEVAEFAAYLLSDLCAFATGSVVPFDGGYTIS